MKSVSARERETERRKGKIRVKETGCWTEVCAGMEFNAQLLDPEQPHAA